MLSFRYPDERYHRFYDGFPAGRCVTADQAYADLHGAIELLDVRMAEKDGVEYTAVQFRSHNGTLLWTTFSKDGEEVLSFFV